MSKNYRHMPLAKAFDECAADLADVLHELHANSASDKYLSLRAQTIRNAEALAFLTGVTRQMWVEMQEFQRHFPIQQTAVTGRAESEMEEQ